MSYDALSQENQDEVVDLFSSVFTTSEGEQEGQFLGTLVRALSKAIDNDSIVGIGCYEKASLIGAIFFTRLEFRQSIDVFMLSPVAVDTSYQGKGIGQALIQHGLEVMRKRQTAIVVTYGDPAFYCKIGFESLSESVIKAPHPLSMPQGWLGQSLSKTPIASLEGRPICVQAFDNPAYW